MLRSLCKIATLSSIGAWLVVAVPGADGEARKIEVLRIGTSGNLGSEAGKEDTARELMKSFIKAETGFDNELIAQKDYQELAKKLAANDLEIGVFQGFEFAWTRAKFARFRLLALAVNGPVYRFAHVLVRQDNQAAKLADLKGQSFALPNIGQAHLPLFVERQIDPAGKIDQFFSSVATPGNIEDALDDVVDGKVAAAVVDRVGLDAYKRRKPGRFAKLKEVVRSEAFPPPVIAYQEGALDAGTVQRFSDGLLNAKRKEKGQMLLNLFKLTGFEPPPADFEEVLKKTAMAYPPPP